MRNLKRAVAQIPRRLLGTFLKVLGLAVPEVRRAMPAFTASRKIDRLEEEGRLDEADALRQATLSRVHPSVTAPLWRSEGFARLRKNDPAGALAAFEAGIGHLEESATAYGVAAPDRLYYGAAVAAVKAGNIETARRYYAQFASVVASLSQYVKPGGRPEWWDEGLRWIGDQIGDHARN